MSTTRLRPRRRPQPLPLPPPQIRPGRTTPIVDFGKPRPPPIPRLPELLPQRLAVVRLTRVTSATRLRPRRFPLHFLLALAQSRPGRTTLILDFGKPRPPPRAALPELLPQRRTCVGHSRVAGTTRLRPRRRIQRRRTTRLRGLHRRTTGLAGVHNCRHNRAVYLQGRPRRLTGRRFLRHLALRIRPRPGTNSQSRPLRTNPGRQLPRKPHRLGTPHLTNPHRDQGQHIVQRHPRALPRQRHYVVRALHNPRRHGTRPTHRPSTLDLPPQIRIRPARHTNRLNAQSR